MDCFSHIDGHDFALFIFNLPPTMELITALIDRIESLNMKYAEVFIKAGLDPRLYAHWKKSEPKPWAKWVNLIQLSGKEIPGPEVSTWKHLGKKAQKLFREAGYTQAELDLRWSKYDSKAVDSYKKILHAVAKLEAEKAGKFKQVLETA